MGVTESPDRACYPALGTLSNAAFKYKFLRGLAVMEASDWLGPVIPDNRSVNHLVVGSNPTRGATFLPNLKIIGWLTAKQKPRAHDGHQSGGEPPDPA